MKPFSFSKYSACGNDFIFIDNRNNALVPLCSTTIQAMCHRRNGIGADGVILLENAPHADYGMRTFNADGSEAAMCGNAMRCLMLFIQEAAVPTNRCTIATVAGPHHLTYKNGEVEISMGAPRTIHWKIALNFQGSKIEISLLDTGVPHAVQFVSNTHTMDIDKIGRAIRYHPNLAPAGANANFAHIGKDSIIHHRVFERGVETETPACGTGAIAVAVAAHTLHGVCSPVHVMTKSGCSLFVTINPIGEVQLRGAARYTFSGVWGPHSRSSEPNKK